VAARVNGPGQQSESLEIQGNVIYPNLDFYAQVGYKKPIDFMLPAIVTNGELSFVVRHMGGTFNDISALQIVPTSLSGTGTSNPPEPPPSVNVIIVK
jgi:hypothetical protein